MKIYSVEQEWLLSDRGIEHGTSKYSALRLINHKTGKFDSAFSGDFFQRIFRRYARTQPILGEWSFPHIEAFVINNLPFPDMSRLSGQTGVHLFSEQVLQKIQNKIENDGEVLPFCSKSLSYSWFRITRVLNALKLNPIQLAEMDHYISYIEKYDFNEEILEGIYLFHLTNHPGTFATDLFVDLVGINKFVGLRFQLIWDSENPDYIDERFKPEVWAEIKARHAKRKT
jgi:hypothetical protein